LGYITEEELKIAEDMSVEIGRLMSGLRKSLLDKININPEYVVEKGEGKTILSPLSSLL